MGLVLLTLVGILPFWIWCYFDTLWQVWVSSHQDLRCSLCRSRPFGCPGISEVAAWWSSVSGGSYTQIELYASHFCHDLALSSNSVSRMEPHQSELLNGSSFQSQIQTVLQFLIPFHRFISKYENSGPFDDPSEIKLADSHTSVTSLDLVPYLASFCLSADSHHSNFQLMAEVTFLMSCNREANMVLVYKIFA